MIDLKWDIILVTESRYVLPDEDNPYKSNIFKDDQVLIDQIHHHGLKVKRVSWSDKEFDWSSTKIALIRTTWDYFEHFEEFKSWLQETGEKCRIINNSDQIFWNLDKIYLKELGQKGITIPPSIFIEKGDNRSLKEIFFGSGWEKAVLKPNVSGGAYHTYVIKNENVDSYEGLFSELIANDDFMLQEFQNSIMTEGEVSYMVINGNYTHAILKLAKEGDFRVQDDHGGTTHDYEASADEIRFAEEVVAVCDPIPDYARVDVIIDNNGKFALSELEIIEPELWFRYCHTSGQLLIDTLVDKYLT